MLKDVLHRIEQRLSAVGLSASAASKLAGLSEDAIRNMQRAVKKDERQGVSTATIFALASVLDTTVSWLMEGRGDDRQFVRVIGRAGADTEGRLIQSDADADYDTAPPPPTGDADAVAVVISGDSMSAVAGDGSLVYFRDQRNPPTQDMVGYNCIVELEDGRVLFKRLLRGSEPGKYMLESQVGPPIDNVRLRWAAEPTAIIPAREAHRIIRKAGMSQVA